MLASTSSKQIQEFAGAKLYLLHAVANSY